MKAVFKSAAMFNERRGNMKKSLAFITAITLLASLMTGCGQDASSSTSTKSSSAISDSADDNDIDNSIQSADNSDIQNALDTLSSAIENKDFEKFMNISLSKKAAKGCKKAFSDSFELSDVDIFEMLDENGPYDFNDWEIQTYSSEDIEYYEKALSILEYAADTDNYEEIDEENFETTVIIDNTSFLRVHGEKADLPVLVYTVDGEWKADCLIFTATVGYVRKSRQTSANAAASSIAKSASAAVYDNIKGFDKSTQYCIISSDRSLNVNVPSDADIDGIYASIEEYFSDISKVNKWFVCINGDEVEYAACEAQKSPNIGTYPSNKLLDKDITKYFNAESSVKYDYTFEDVYSACLKELGL